MYAAAMATEFEIGTVVIPPRPGLFSAIGLLVADIQHHAVMSLSRRQKVDAADLTERFERLESELHGRFAKDGQGTVTIERFADMRYRGQSSELRIPVPDGKLDDGSLRELQTRFDLGHERTFGHRGSQYAPETLNIRVRARRAADARGGDILDYRPNGDAAAFLTRQAYFGPGVGLIDTPVLPRAALAGARRAGPIVVEEMDATTLIPPGWNVSLDDFGNLVMETA
jgi:N-methylhydantoinase A